MKHLITCANAGEAGLIQSLLASEGIEVELRDGRSDVGNIAAAQLFVAEEHHAQATSLIAYHTPAVGPNAETSPHPAANFPFLRIMGFVAVAWSLGYVAFAAFSYDAATWANAGVVAILLELLFIGAMAFAWGLFIGSFVALIGLIAKVTWKKLRS